MDGLVGCGAGPVAAATALAAELIEQVAALACFVEVLPLDGLCVRRALFGMDELPGRAVLGCE